MLDLKSMYKQKNFQINPLVLKSVRSLNLSMNEFLIILYFMNEEPYLDLDKIKNMLGLNDEEILDTYSSLLGKGLIEVIVKKERGVVNETISLDMFYDKLILGNVLDKEEDKNTDVFAMFENEFGRTLSPIEYEMINKWLTDKIPEETIKNALKEAVLKGTPNLKYIDAIIYAWTRQGSVAKEEYKELLDIDWLGGNYE